MDVDGVPDSTGTSEIIVGTGGHYLRTHIKDDPRVATSLLETYGALRLTLSDQQAEYEFIDTLGTVLDSGTVYCNPDEKEDIGPIESIPPTLAPPATGTIVDTSGLRALCLANPDYNSAVIALLPEGTRVELRGAPVGDWQSVRCADQDGYVARWFIRPDD